jgi:hypothetical protein
MRLMLAFAAAATLAACTWVEPDAGGASVRVIHDKNLGGCEDLRKTITVSVRAEVMGVERNRIKVRDELESLARNEAAREGADTIQAISEPVDGEQRFAAYRCR